jgi:putative DNA primase/helicase
LTGHTSEACVFYIYGPTRSGKGTFTQTLQRLLGKPMSAGIDFQVLVANREADAQNFALAPLKPCRLVVGSEPGKYERFNEAKLKLLTGEDVVRCSFKRQDHFEFVPQFKIWLSSNWPFNADTSDDAAWGRARVVEFPNSFLGNEDKHLKARLQADDCMQGVLAWAVEGAVKWYGSAGGLRTPPAVQRAGEEQRAAQDYIQQFLEECVDVGDAKADFVGARELYKVYTKWCEGELTPQKSRSFSLSIQSKGFHYGRSYVTMRQMFMDDEGQMVGKKQIRGYYGLKLNSVGHDLLLAKALR